MPDDPNPSGAPASVPQPLPAVELTPLPTPPSNIDLRTSVEYPKVEGTGNRDFHFGVIQSSAEEV